MTGGLIFRLWQLLVSYIEGVLMAYVLIIMFGLVTVLVIGTQLEGSFIDVLAITPGIGLGKGGNFSVDENGVVFFFLIWGAIVTLFSGLLNKFTKIKVNFGSKVTLLIGSIVHLVSLVVFSYRLSFWFAMLFIGLLFATFLLSMFFLRKIGIYKSALNKLQEEY